MPRYWFSDYDGSDWNPSCGYNESFVFQIRVLRERFRLKKTEIPGTEIGGEWVHYITANGIAILIAIPNLSWRETGFWIFSHERVISPVLKIELRVGEEKEPGFFRSRNIKVFWEDEIQITFPESFPTISPSCLWSGKPQIRVSKGYGGAEKNILSHGILCVMNNAGDWDPEEDNVCRSVEVAADWATRYFRK